MGVSDKRTPPALRPVSDVEKWIRRNSLDALHPALSGLKWPAHGLSPTGWQIYLAPISTRHGLLAGGQPGHYGAKNGRGKCCLTFGEAMRIQTFERGEQLRQERPLAIFLHRVLHTVAVVETADAQGVTQLAILAVHVSKWPLNGARRALDEARPHHQ